MQDQKQKGIEIESLQGQLAIMTADNGSNVIRAASKNERRYITRHALDFYRALTMTGMYTLDLEKLDGIDPMAIEAYIPALKWCIAVHPSLRTAIWGQDGESPVFVCPGRMDLKRHVRVRDFGEVLGSEDGEEDEILKRVLLETHDEAFEGVDRVPPWRIVVLPLPTSRHRPDCDEKMKVYVIFAYSHSVGDGRSGLAFHKTFLEGLRVGRRAYDSGYDFDVTTGAQIQDSGPQLPPPLEEACTLKITWSYLLLTLFGGYVPETVKRWLGFQVPTVTEGTWTGNVMSYPGDPKDFRTGMAILTFPKARMDAILRVCRQKGGVKFTGLLNQLIVRALSGALGASQVSFDRIIGQIVIDLRGLVPAYSEDMMVNCVSAMYESSLRHEGKFENGLKNDTAFWDAGRKTTIRLAESASTFIDQPIGLLKYLGEFRAWFLEKLGKRRDSSYEISNAVVFNPSSKSAGEDADEHKMGWDIDRMVFSQPANVTSCPLSFSVVTVKGGDMVLTVNWQVGILGIEDEDAFVGDLLARMEGYLIQIGEN